MSNRDNLAELMFLFKIGLSCLTSKISLISRTSLLFSFAKMVNSSKDEILLQFHTWSEIALSSDGLVFLNVKGAILIGSPDITFMCLSLSPSQYYGYHYSIIMNIEILVKIKFGCKSSSLIMNVVTLKMSE